MSASASAGETGATDAGAAEAGLADAGHASGARLAFVIGDPIEHSKSPNLHNAAFAAVGLSHVYDRIRANADEVGAVIERFRAERWLGLSVTMPDKEAVITYLDRLTPHAQRLGAVNCVYWDGDDVCGDNTDGAGLVWAIRDHLGTDVAVKVGVLGAGGAARAAILAFTDAGATKIVVVNRTHERAVSAAALAGAVGVVGTPDDLGDCDIVINATPQGMGDTGAVSLPPYIAGAGQLAYDLIYHPPSTPWMQACEANGAEVSNGLSMLIGQAAVQFTRWTGLTAPTDAMIAAVAEPSRRP